MPFVANVPGSFLKLCFALLRVLMGWLAGLAPWLAMSASRLITGNYDKFFRSPEEQMTIEWLFLLLLSGVAIAAAGASELFRYYRRGLRPGPLGFWPTAVIAFAAPPVAFGTVYFLVILAILLEVSGGRAILALTLLSVLGLLGAGVQTFAWAWREGEVSDQGRAVR